MKKIIKIVLVLFVTLTLGACGSSEEKDTNKTESWLPETGGMGTVIFTVVGVVGVLVILSTYFKKGKKEEA